MTAPTFGDRFTCRRCRGKASVATRRAGVRAPCPDCDGGLVTAAQLRVQLSAVARKILADPRSGPWDRASAQAYLNGPRLPAESELRPAVTRWPMAHRVLPRPALMGGTCICLLCHCCRRWHRFGVCLRCARVCPFV